MKKSENLLKTITPHAIAAENPWGDRKPMSLTQRIGQFFFLLGILILLIFVVLNIAGPFSFPLIFFGIVFLIVGISFMRRGRDSPPSN